jgi:hypothetical protein
MLLLLCQLLALINDHGFFFMYASKSVNFSFVFSHFYDYHINFLVVGSSIYMWAYAGEFFFRLWLQKIYPQNPTYSF